MQVMQSKLPNPAHLAIAECESRLSKQGRSVVVITQNIDELHHRSGSKHVYEIHGEKKRHLDDYIITHPPYKFIMPALVTCLRTNKIQHLAS